MGALASLRSKQIAAAQQRLEVGEHCCEVGLRCTLLGDPDQIEPARQPLAILPKHLADQPLDAVARDRVADLAGDRDAESGRLRLARSIARWLAPRCEDHEVPQLMLAPASLHAQEFASLLDPQARRKSMWAHDEPSLAPKIDQKTKSSSRSDHPSAAAQHEGDVQGSSSLGSLAASGRAEALATATATGRNDLATAFGGHPRPKSVSAGPAEVVGLISTLGHFRIPGGCEGAGSIAAGLGTVKPALMGPMAGWRTLFCSPDDRPTGFGDRRAKPVLEPVDHRLRSRRRMILRSVVRAEQRHTCPYLVNPPWHGPAIAEAVLWVELAKPLAKQVCELAVAQTRCSCRRVRAGVHRLDLSSMISNRCK